MDCSTGLRFALNTTAPAAIDTAAVDNIHLIFLRPYALGVFNDSTVLANTKLNDRLQPCNHGLSAYNDWASYVTDADIIVNATLPSGHTWNWSINTPPSSTQYDFATAIRHELSHAALLCHTQPGPQSASNIMAPTVLISTQIQNYSGDPDDLIGIQHMISLGRTLGAAGSCTPGMAAFFICPTPTPPGPCGERITTTNGITEVAGSTAAFTVALYPNPYEDNTVIHIDVAEYTDFSITVFDIVGHQVRQINTGSGTSFDVPLSGFNESAGMYLIEVSDSRTRQILKMIKL